MDYTWTAKRSLRLRKIVAGVTAFATVFMATPAAAATRVAPHPTARVIVQQMFKHLPDVKTLHMASTITVDSAYTYGKSKQPDSGMHAEVAMDSYIDGSDANNPASYSSMGISGYEMPGGDPMQPYD